MRHRVDEFLSASERTQRLGNLPMGRGRQLAVWQNSHDEIQYSATRGHVFSLYLNGGSGTRRVDGKVKSGAPATLCVFPEGHSSEWQINETFRFVHLYVADELLRSAFSQVHEKDARQLDIDERTFVDPGALEQPMRAMAQATLTGDIMSAEAGFADLVAALGHQLVALKGGLTRRAIREVSDWVNAHIAEDIKLSDLAQLAGLSEFHFHRMFRQSCGMAPHAWVTQMRLMRAKDMLTSESMAQIALACGFSSQGHFIRRFKDQYGVTPGQYLRLAC
ncbi:AraC family transcriptional regulator [Cognatishimia sp. WU-CL00825]|uniref:AraC family transcriptional regulator n=1 Tax=Cognatishimia sp. WU-CL00825 TaxID=3127658 RepID=UPI0031039987